MHCIFCSHCIFARLYAQANQGMCLLCRVHIAHMCEMARCAILWADSASHFHAHAQRQVTKGNIADGAGMRERFIACGMP